MKEPIFQMESMLINQMNQKSCGSYLCDGCYSMTQKCNKLKNIAIIRIKKTVYRICFLFMSKRETKRLMANSNVIDKKAFL